MEPGGVFDSEGGGDGPPGSLVRIVVALASCAALMAVAPAEVAGAGLLPTLGSRPPAPSRPQPGPRPSPPVPANATRTIRLSLPLRPLHPLRVEAGRGRAPVLPTTVGCRRTGPTLVRHGTRRGRRVALTFDDGPGPYTPAILKALRRVHVHATFFQIGRQIPGQNHLERQMVRAGHTLGDHSYSHPPRPSRWQLASTKALIERAGRYRPCLFRPPYGIVDPALQERARRLGMTAVLWDVDPSDYEDPGGRVLVQRVVSHVRPGSIIVMHDGGGMRAQTVAAVPGLVNALRRRGYRLVTVDHLLGYRRAYSP
jgi:peptidoglycan-N-acetylglucosamine deacetylase